MTELRFLSDFAVDYVDHMGSDARVVEAMLASTKGLAAAEAATDSVEGRLRWIMGERHGGPFEHGAMTFRVHAPVKVWREWHRHRAGWSYSEMSGRYVDLPPDFYLPPPDRPMMRREGFRSSRPVFGAATEEEYEAMSYALRSGYIDAYGTYETLLAQGVDRGLARDVLGVGIYSVCYVTCNPRSLMHFLELRTEEKAARRPSKPLWEIAKCAKKLEAIFAERWPITHSLWDQNGRMAP
jgi:thymidylate synthase (FAD)